MQIIKDQYIHYKNLLSYKTKINPENIFLITKYISNNLDKIGIKHQNKIIFYIDNYLYPEQKHEIEFLIPVDKMLANNDHFSFKPTFKMVNTVKIRHEGSPETLNTSYKLLLDYIKQNKQEPITPAYCMIIREDANQPTNGIIDIYIGLNSNIL